MHMTSTKQRNKNYKNNNQIIIKAALWAGFFHVYGQFWKNCSHVVKLFHRDRLFFQIIHDQ